MERSFQLYITLDNEFYTSKSLITGTLHVKSLEPFNLETIDIILTKSFESEIKVSDSTILSEKHTIYSKRFSLYKSEVMKIASGHHQFPFSFYIRATDNASTNAIIPNDKEKICIKNNYIICGEVKVYGAYMPIATTHKELNVVDVNNVVCVENMVVKLASCFCFFKDSFKLKSVINKEFYYSGEIVYINLNAGNNIKSVDMYLYQVISLNINDCLKTRCRIINEEHVDLNDSNGEIGINIGDMPSTASEMLFDIKYVLQVVVRFGSNTKVQYKHDVFVMKRLVDEDCGKYLDVLKGVDALVKYFVMD